MGRASDFESFDLSKSGPSRFSGEMCFRTLGWGSKALFLPLRLGAVAVVAPEDPLPLKRLDRENEEESASFFWVEPSPAFITKDSGLSCCFSDDLVDLLVGRDKAGPIKVDQAEAGTALQQIAKAISKPLKEECTIIFFARSEDLRLFQIHFR